MVYWAMTTMSTVGYGDICPESDGERIFCLFAMCIGGAFYGVALPATLWNFFSCGFFAHAHAQGYALTMRRDLFAIAASIVSDEHNHMLHHLFPRARGARAAVPRTLAFSPSSLQIDTR